MKNNSSSNKIVQSGFWTNLFRSNSDISETEVLLHSIPLFKDFTQKELNGILSLVHTRNYANDEHIFFEGDPGIGMYIVLEGEVLIKRSLYKDINLALLTKGDFFGELALLDDEKRSASAIAKRDSKIAVIFKPDLDEFIDRFPKRGAQILKGINQILVTRLRKLNQDFISLYIKNLNAEVQNE